MPAPAKELMLKQRQNQVRHCLSCSLHVTCPHSLPRIRIIAAADVREHRPNRSVPPDVPEHRPSPSTPSKVIAQRKAHEAAARDKAAHDEEERARHEWAKRLHAHPLEEGLDLGGGDDEVEEDDPEDYALFCLAPSNSFRRLCADIILSHVFEHVILTLIVLSSIGATLPLHTNKPLSPEPCS